MALIMAHGRSLFNSKKTGYTDGNLHLLVNSSLNPKYDYTPGISRELYFKEDGFSIPLHSDKANPGIFPQGFVNSHITNKIDSVRYIEVNYTPYYLSQPLFREGFVNLHLFYRDVFGHIVLYNHTRSSDEQHDYFIAL